MSPSKSDSGEKRLDEEPLPTTQKRPRIEKEQVKKIKHISTKAEWEEAKKTHWCHICGGIGHFESACKLTSWCSTKAKVTPFAEIVCWCCGELVEKNHPNQPLSSIGRRARLKE